MPDTPSTPGEPSADGHGELSRRREGGGGSAAHLVYKYRLPPRLDLLPFYAFFASIPLIFVDRRFVLVSAFFLFAAVGALLYNELFRKGKGPLLAAASLLPMLAYYQVRLAGYLVEAAKVRLGIRKIQRVNLREGPSARP